jgi:DNA uptake protein ComE-like DNA-binding protein
VQIEHDVDMPSTPRRVTPWVAAVAFAVTPFVTLGFLTPVAFTLAAVLRRSWLLGAAAAVYTVAVAGMFALDSDSGLYSASIITALLVGGVHAVAVSPWIARTLRNRHAIEESDLLETVAHEENAALAADPTLRRALRRRERRRRARQIVATDPALADELQIGRLGQHRRFDDGGLVDVNRVDAAALSALPGFTAAMADRVVAARERFEGLRSDADLIVHADVPPEVVARLRERLLFRPLDVGASDAEPGVASDEV